MLDVVIFLIFVLALLAFALSPAISLVERFSDKYSFIDKNSTFLSITLALCFSLIATTFIFQF